ncbi:TolC family protein [Paucibacter sp. AS339]|uniref:TolC family protein n=1 Tax=Paucibacter hankyongi TaxID=3133434 RepID=UPI00309C2E29
MSLRRPVFLKQPWPALALGFCLALPGLPLRAAEAPAATANQATINTLAEALAQAWPRHPAARSASAAQALIAQQNEAADRWLAAPPSLQLSRRSDGWGGAAQGLREDEAALELPLRWPGERQAERRSAEAQGQQWSRAQAAARWTLSGELREAWWALRLAATEQTAAEQQLANLQALRADVERRLKAGDLARLDLNQALSAEQTAQAALAEAQAARAAAQSAWALLVGSASTSPEPLDSTFDPASAEAPAATSTQEHPALSLLQARYALLSAQLARAQAGSYAGPTVGLALLRERGSSLEPAANSARLTLRLPLGRQPEAGLQAAQLAAERAELEAEIARFSDAQAAAIAQARQQMARSAEQAALAQSRQALAADSLGLQRRAFSLGAIDLPTRLRAEADKAQAELALARARIEQQRSASRLSQALGLTP